MKIIFVTNFINHHQVPLAEEFYKLTNCNYWLVATQEIPESFKKSGYPDYSNKSYLIKAYESERHKQYALQMINNADVAIIGNAPEYYVHQRIKQSKLTFRYSERWFKKKEWYKTGLKGWLNIYLNHLRYKNKPLYMLAASAYTANDVYAVGAYKNKVFKWGYFTSVDKFDINTKFSIKREHLRILWCSRFINWKHPELPVFLAKKLSDNGYDFELNMYGSGENVIYIENLIKKLEVENVVNICGNVPNAELMKQMRQHDVFLFTSDRNEGWGAVLNEAMSNACAVVASNQIGATPFLIENGTNGLVFESGNIDSLYNAVKFLVDNPKLRENLSREAYKSMCNLWSPAVAATNFIKLSESILYGSELSIKYGPCSKAYPIKLIK